jgi:hypothetical protein
VQKILTHKPEGRRVDTGAASIYAARQRQVSTWRIGLEFLRLNYGPGRLKPEEYFLEGAWRPGLTWAQRKEFVGLTVSQALNRSLNPPKETSSIEVMVDKLATASRFAEAGIPQPRILAVAAAEQPMPHLRWLVGPEATAEFLKEPGTIPCFGKPVHGSIGLGAASFVDVDSSGSVLLGSGLWAPSEDITQEVWASYSRGYVFQELVRPHPALAALIGPVIGTLRIVTIDAGDGPEALYANIKAPGAGAMVDSLAGPIGCYAAVELATGKVLRLQDRRQMGGTDLERFPLTDAKVDGSRLPDFSEAVKLAVSAHRAIGNRGILGVDVLLSDKGPLINEVNSSPFHSSYQIAFARGILNADFLPKLRAVRARFKDVTPRDKLCPLP